MAKIGFNGLDGFLPLVKGSPGWTSMKCGNPRCKCARGELHTACYLSYRKQGKTHTIHIPKALVGEIEQYCENWKKLRAVLEKQTEQVLLGLLKEYRAKQKINRKKGGSVVGKTKRSKRSAAPFREGLSR